MAASKSLTTISSFTLLKWGMFRLLERLSDLRGNTASGHLELNPPQHPLASLWVFVSTIGELNAIDPLLREIIARVPQLKLVLITDHPHYRDSYLARYPAAEVCVTRGHSTDAAALARHYPPKLLVVAEIPCWPSDAPCRFSFAFLLEAKRSGASAVLVNAWLYHYVPSSRMDGIERHLFQKDYLRAFDAIGAQTDEMQQKLLAAGADSDRVTVTGNIKFDAMLQPEWSPAKARSPAMLGALIQSARPVIVAGCLTDLTELQMVLDAFITVREHHPSALLVLAPRHPEATDQMVALRDLVKQSRLPTVFRSELADAPIEAPIACMVLDTMGELRDFYAAATVAHVGVDHNVLEPLGFEKPVTVKPGWNTTYPSYPVYRLLMDTHALIEVSAPAQLSGHWLDLIENASRYREKIALINHVLTHARGAVKRHLDLISRLMQAPMQQ